MAVERTDAERVNGENGAARKSGFRELIAWQKAMALVTAIYRATGDWPREELYGLTSQVRRAAVSIPSNLAEGHGRTGPREFAIMSRSRTVRCASSKRKCSSLNSLAMPTRIRAKS